MAETEEEIIARQKKEKRDLVATTTGMKKQANKKTRKKVNKQVQEMEEALEKRHAEELKAFRSGDADEDADEDLDDLDGELDDEDSDELTPAELLAQLELSEKAQAPAKETAKNAEKSANAPKKHRNRQKERLAKRDAAIKDAQEKARAEAATMPDRREIEMNNLKELCDLKGLEQYDIPPDGHCLFASIADQLQLRHDIDISVPELRRQAAEYIRSDPDTFIPFLFDEKTMSLKDVGEYTKELETTPMWGGDLEILALAKVFDCPISVLMSGRAPLVMNEDGQQPELKIVYYQHSFGLGEHYNSLRDAQSAELETDEAAAAATAAEASENDAATDNVASIEHDKEELERLDEFV